MSPAMVEVPNPINQGKFFTSVRDQQQGNPNPRDKGKIFTPLFDQNTIFTNPQQKNPNPNIRTMDRSSNKPLLSKARFTKVGKTFVNRKPQSIPNSEKIEEKINRWNPFVPESGLRVSENLSANANASTLGFGGTNFDAGKFVFGSGGPNLRTNSSCRSAGSFDSVKSERFEVAFGSGVGKNDCSSHESSLGSEEGLVFLKPLDDKGKMNFVFGGSGSGDDSEKKRQVENGFVFGGSSVNRGNSDAGYFVFGAGVKKSVDLSQNFSVVSDEGSFSKLPDEIRKHNLKDAGNVDDFRKKKQAENIFVYGGSMNVPGSTGSVSGSQPINVWSEKPNTRSVSFGSEGSGNSDEIFSVFRSGTNENVDASGLEKGSFSKLPAEMRKLNLQNSGNVDDFEKIKQSENIFVSGGSKTGSRSTGLSSGAQPINVGSEKTNAQPVRFGSEGSGTSDEGVFIFGSGANKSVDASSLEKGLFSKLPDEMRKLNLKKSANVDDFEKNKKAENVFVFWGSKSGSESSAGSNVNKIPESAEFGSFDGATSGSKTINTRSKKPSVVSFSFGSEGSGKSNTGAFVVGSDGKRNVHLSRNPSLGSDEGLFCKLPNERRKTNLTSGDGLEEMRFKADRDSTGFFYSGVANKVPEETGKVNVRRETTTQSVKNETVGSAAGQFVFGRSTEKSSVSSFDNGAAFNQPIDNFSTKGLEKVKEMSHREKVDGGDSFVFGAGENTTTFLGGNACFNMLHDDMKKLNIGTNTEQLAGNVPCEFTFQVGKQDHRANMTSIPSSPAPNFQYSGPAFSFTGKPVGLETPHMEFKTPKPDATLLSKETLFAGAYQNMPFSSKKSEARKAKKKKKSGISRPSAPVYHNFVTKYFPEECDLQANPEVDSTGGCSPMDCSPYHEESVIDQSSRETSVASEDSFHFFSCCPSADTRKAASSEEQEEILVSEAQRLNIGEVGDDNGSEDVVKRNSIAESVFLDEQTDKFGNGSETSKLDNVDLHNDARISPMDAEAGSFSSSMGRSASESGIKFTFSSSLIDLGESNFKFTASPSVQGQFPSVKHNSRRKNRLKRGQNPSVSTTNDSVSMTSPLPDLIPRIIPSGIPDSIEGQKGTSSAPRSEDEGKTGKSKGLDARQESTSSASASVAAQEVCEKWRFRGNQAYANGHLIKAEDYYTRGVNSFPPNEIPSGCIKPLSLCYSNRAATRMSLGKWREALNDCKMAVSLDPDFLKARVRVANCHLALGEIEEALNQFKKCLQSEKAITSDQKYIIEASDGLQKAQQVADLTGQSAELLSRRTTNDASKALNVISEALSVSPHSESLLEMKAEALLMMRNYEEIIKLCEQTLDLAEQNSLVTEANSQFENVNSSDSMKSSPPRLWRWRLIAKSYFYLGKLEEALELLQKLETAEPAVDKSSEASTSFAAVVCELLRLKTAGNEAFQAARHSEAVDYYSSALACNAESRPFAAVCFCNRAAAYQALGQISDAIADCSIAIALDPSYAKAISRRGTLHEMIRDYGQAANDLNRLISLLQKQTQKEDNESIGVGKSSSNVINLKRARARLATVEEEARKGPSLNMYMILGVEPSSSAADVKKAYRKAALRHHPDKAGQFLVRNENVDDGLWKEVAAEVHADADRLFKMIGEAYTTLSDPTKRLQYDEDEEMRTSPVKGYNVGSPKTSSDYTYYSSHHEKNFNQRQWRHHGNLHRRW